MLDELYATDSSAFLKCTPLTADSQGTTVWTTQDQEGFIATAGSIIADMQRSIFFMQSTSQKDGCKRDFAAAMGRHLIKQGRSLESRFNGRESAQVGTLLASNGAHGNSYTA
jgi:hypothetical protein